MAFPFSRLDNQWRSGSHSRAGTGVSSDTRLLSSSSMGNLGRDGGYDRSSRQTSSNAILVSASPGRSVDRARGHAGDGVAANEPASKASEMTGITPSEWILPTCAPSKPARLQPAAFVQGSLPIGALGPTRQSVAKASHPQNPGWFAAPINLALPQRPLARSPSALPAKLQPSERSTEFAPPITRYGASRSVFTAATPSETYINANPPRWRQPRFQASEGSDVLLSRDQMRPPILGGRSKKDQLGSVNESWGDDGEERFGLFTIEPDPPSPPNPFAVDEPEEFGGGFEVGYEEEVREARAKALKRAREGTGFEFE